MSNLDEILDWNVRAITEAYITHLMATEPPKKVVTVELINKHKSKAVKQIQQWAIDTLKEVLGEEVKPNQVDKTPKLRLKTVTEIGFAGEVVQTATQDNEETYTEQEMEDVAFALIAKPYIDQFRQTILKDFTERIEK